MKIPGGGVSGADGRGRGGRGPRGCLRGNWGGGAKYFLGGPKFPPRYAKISELMHVHVYFACDLHVKYFRAFFNVSELSVISFPFPPSLFPPSPSLFSFPLSFPLAKLVEHLVFKLEALPQVNFGQSFAASANPSLPQAVFRSFRKSRLRWKSISIAVLQAVLRSFDQPLLPQAVLRSFSQFRLQ